MRIAAQKEQALVEKRQSILAVTSRLKDHDRTFTKAQILATDLESMEDDQKLKVRVTDLTSTLAKLVSEEVHCRLDRLYLETLQRGDVESTMAVSGDGSALILEEDLESLYSEVEILAEMWASQQFGQPISTELQRINAQRNHSVDDKLDLVSGIPDRDVDCSRCSFRTTDPTFDFGHDFVNGEGHGSTVIPSIILRSSGSLVDCLQERNHSQGL